MPYSTNADFVLQLTHNHNPFVLNHMDLLLPVFNYDPMFYLPVISLEYCSRLG